MWMCWSLLPTTIPRVGKVLLCKGPKIASCLLVHGRNDAGKSRRTACDEYGWFWQGNTYTADAGSCGPHPGSDIASLEPLNMLRFRARWAYLGR